MTLIFVNGKNYSRFAENVSRRVQRGSKSKSAFSVDGFWSRVSRSIWCGYWKWTKVLRRASSENRAYRSFYAWPGSFPHNPTHVLLLRRLGLQPKLKIYLPLLPLVRKNRACHGLPASGGGFMDISMRQRYEKL